MFEHQPHWAKASIANVLAANAQLKTDVAALTALVTQLITAFQAPATGGLTPAQAQQLLSDLQGDDTTIASATASIQSALAPAATPAQTA